MSRDIRNRRRFESLESRLLLASDAVTAVVTAHNLSIVGDGKADAFLVAGDGTAGDVVITGFVGSDGNQTLINGSTSVTLTGVTGNVTMALGSGNVTVSVADLNIGKNLTITGGNGNDTIDIGTDATLTPCVAATDAVTIGSNLTIVAGNGNNSITVGETPDTGTDVTVGGTMTVTVGKGNNSITELSLAVTDSEAITAGAGSNTISIGGPTVAGSGVTIGQELVIVAGNGGDTITEASVGVGDTEAIALGSGNNSVKLGAAVLTPSVKAVNPAIHAAAVNQLVADGDVAIGGNLIAILGSGNSSFSATDVQVGDTILVLGGLGYGSLYGFNFNVNLTPGNLSADASAFANPLALLLGGMFGHGSTDTITLSDVTAEGTGIFTGLKDTDTVNIQGSVFDDLGVGLGTGAGSLSVGTTTTYHSTTLVGLGNKNTYDNLGGNSFTKPIIIGFI